MFNTNSLAIISGINIFLLATAVLNLFKKKQIINFLLGFSAIGLIIMEVGKLSLLFNLNFTDRAIGFGFCLIPIFWLIASVSLLPAKTSSVSRVILSPLLGLATLIFFIVWWIKPFIVGVSLDIPGGASLLARYFFVLVVFDLSLVLSNLERSVYYTRQKEMRLLFGSAFLLLVPYIILAAYTVISANLSAQFLAMSSLITLFGSFMFMLLSGREFWNETVSEDTAVHTSVSLFLIGGYLFFVGAFVKLFQTYGWNLNTLFSLLSTLFVLFAFLFIMFSSSFRDRLGAFFLRRLTRQKYDWQKIWEDYTYKVSRVYEFKEITQRIEKAVKNIIGAKQVKMIIFDQAVPFEEDFSDWFLRYGGPLTFDEFCNNDSAHKYPLFYKFFKQSQANVISAVYGEKKIIGIITINLPDKDLNLLDKELLKVLSLQASGAIVSLRSHQKAAEAEKKASLYKVSSFIIHDIKNYISSLSLLVANKDKFNQPEFVDDALVTLEHTIGKMQAMINEFRALRGDIVLNKQPHKLKKLVEEAVADVGRERFKQVNLAIDVDESLVVKVDPRYINKVFLNLILNALDAMDNKGNIKIATGRSNGYVDLSIEDNGCGMAREFISSRLFKPFSSTKENGLGIGLYQCKSIVEAHQGIIEAESQPGQGTKFKVRLLPA